MRKFFAPFVAAGLSALVSLGATFTASAAEPQPLVSVSWLNEGSAAQPGLSTK